VDKEAEAMSRAEKRAQDKFESTYDKEYRDKISNGPGGEALIQVMRSTFVSGYYSAMADVSEMVKGK